MWKGARGRLLCPKRRWFRPAWVIVNELFLHITTLPSWVAVGQPRLDAEAGTSESMRQKFRFGIAKRKKM